MNRRVLPYLFLLVLFIIIVFIMGLRYGKKVEEANKTIRYLISLTPPASSLSITPTPIRYLTYNNKKCGISFLYPSSLKPTGESTASAMLNGDTSTMLSFSCEKTGDIAKILEDSKIATYEGTFKNRKISGKKQGETVYLKITNPNTGTLIYMSVDKNLLPLLDSTLQFTP